MCGTHLGCATWLHRAGKRSVAIPHIRLADFGQGGEILRQIIRSKEARTQRLVSLEDAVCGGERALMPYDTCVRLFDAVLDATVYFRFWTFKEAQCPPTAWPSFISDYLRASYS